MNFRKLRNGLMRGKQYISRTVTYLAIVNSGMILFLALSKLKELGYINWEIDKYFTIIFIIGLVGLFILGWMDIKLFKGIQRENTIAFELSPPFMEMRSKINDLWKKQNEQ